MPTHNEQLATLFITAERACTEIADLEAQCESLIADDEERNAPDRNVDLATWLSSKVLERGRTAHQALVEARLCIQELVEKSAGRESGAT